MQLNKVNIVCFYIMWLYHNKKIFLIRKKREGAQNFLVMVGMGIKWSDMGGVSDTEQAHVKHQIPFTPPWEGVLTSLPSPPRYPQGNYSLPSTWVTCKYKMLVYNCSNAFLNKKLVIMLEL